MKQVIAKLLTGEPLNADEAQRAFELIMTGQATAAQIGATLGMIQMRGPSVSEITGAARVMRDKVTPVTPPPGVTVIDTCGTGGDHAGTFNVSTAAALVAAGAGRPANVAVAKHGNRAVTSKSGSSQVLETLGVKLQVSSETLSQCLDQAGVCFCFAPAHHPAMRYAGPIRAELAIRTIFNILGPLTNPASASRQVIGVFDPALTEPLAQVLLNLGAVHAMIVHGLTPAGSIDEISTFGPTRVTTVANGKITTAELTPDELGIAPGVLADTVVDGPEQSAQLIRRVLDGEEGSARDLVIVNAAAALVVAGVAQSMAQGIVQARNAIDSGAASASLEQLVKITQADPTPAA